VKERWCEPAESLLLQQNPHVACGSAPWQIIRKTMIPFPTMLPGWNANMKPPIFTRCFPHASFTYLCGYAVYSLHTLIYVLPYPYVQMHLPPKFNHALPLHIYASNTRLYLIFVLLAHNKHTIIPRTNAARRAVSKKR